jgi:hypothetical protein
MRSHRSADLSTLEAAILRALKCSYYEHAYHFLPFAGGSGAYAPSHTEPNERTISPAFHDPYIYAHSECRRLLGSWSHVLFGGLQTKHDLDRAICVQ